MKHLLQKICQAVYTHYTIPVTDVKTKQKEIAEYEIYFGMWYKINYKPLKIL